jgi:hypothetical protein
MPHRLARLQQEVSGYLDLHDEQQILESMMLGTTVMSVKGVNSLSSWEYTCSLRLALTVVGDTTGGGGVGERILFVLWSRGERVLFLTWTSQSWLIYVQIQRR